MKCPKCSHVQADGLPECGRCGVIFAKIPPSAPSVTVIENTSGGGEVDTGLADLEAPKRPSSIAVLAVLAALVVAALYLVNKPTGRSAAGATQVNAEKGYAYTAPADWLALTPKNFDELMKPYRDRFRADLRTYIDKARFDVSHFRIPDKEGEFAPSINLIAIDLKGQRMPELTDSEKAKATEVISAQMKTVLPTYRVQNSRVIEVDGIQALELSGTASLRVVEKPSEPILGEPGPTGNVAILGKTEEVAREIELKSVQTFVPARRYGLLLTCNFLLADPHDTQSTCRQVVNSFRVTARPARFDVITLGAINGGLVGALAFLLFAIARRLTKR
jgi:hypothetical protein